MVFPEREQKLEKADAAWLLGEEGTQKPVSMV